MPESTVAQTDSGPVRTVTCGVTADTRLTDDGIGELKARRPVVDIKRHCDVISDSMQPGAEGQTERVLAVRFGRETISAIVVDDKVWRIDVRTSRFTTVDSLGVDTPLRRLARMKGARFDPGEDGVYGFVAAHCGLSFRFSLPLRPPAGGQWTAARIEKEHGYAAVDRVLVKGCRR